MNAKPTMNRPSRKTAVAALAVLCAAAALAVLATASSSDRDRPADDQTSFDSSPLAR